MDKKYISFEEVARITTKNLDKVIDVNLYTIDETKNSNMKHRPIGLGVNGLADVFALLKDPKEQKIFLMQLKQSHLL